MDETPAGVADLVLWVENANQQEVMQFLVVVAVGEHAERDIDEAFNEVREYWGVRETTWSGRDGDAFYFGVASPWANDESLHDKPLTDLEIARLRARLQGRAEEIVDYCLRRARTAAEPPADGKPPSPVITRSDT